jgi:hypothetical protein
MKSFVRNALLGAAGLVIVAMPAQAASSTAAGDSQATTKQMQIAQRNENPGGAGYRNENPGGPGFKKAMKHKKHKKMHKKMMHKKM